MKLVIFFGRDLADLVRRIESTGRGIPDRGIRINGIWQLEYSA